MLDFVLDQTRKRISRLGPRATWRARGSVETTTCRSAARFRPQVGEAADLGTLEEVNFEFRSSGELTNVQTLRHLSAAQAAHAVDQLEHAAAAALGAPSTVGGEPTRARGLLSTYVAVHAFTDYRATLSATNPAPTGMMVREEYLSTR